MVAGAARTSSPCTVAALAVVASSARSARVRRPGHQGPRLSASCLRSRASCCPPAQLVDVLVFEDCSAIGWGPGGRRFKSRLPDAVGRFRSARGGQRDRRDRMAAVIHPALGVERVAHPLGVDRVATCGEVPHGVDSSTGRSAVMTDRKPTTSTSSPTTSSGDPQPGHGSLATSQLSPAWRVRILQATHLKSRIGVPSVGGDPDYTCCQNLEILF